MIGYLGGYVGAVLLLFLWSRAIYLVGKRSARPAPPRRRRIQIAQATTGTQRQMHLISVRIIEDGRVLTFDRVDLREVDDLDEALATRVATAKSQLRSIEAAERRAAED